MKRALRSSIEYARRLPNCCFTLARKRLQEKCRSCSRHSELVKDSLHKLTDVRIIVCALENVPEEIPRYRHALLTEQYPNAEIYNIRSSVIIESADASLMSKSGDIDLLIVEGGNQTGIGPAIKYDRLVSTLKPSHTWLSGAFCECGIRPLACWLFHFRQMRGFLKSNIPTLISSVTVLLVRLLSVLVPRAKNISSSKRDHILVSIKGQVGDIVASTPALRALRLSYPEAYLIYLTTPIGEQILGECPYKDKLLVYRPGLEVGHYASLALNVAAYGCGRAFQIGTLATNAEAFISYMAGIKCRVGLGKHNKLMFNLRPFTQTVNLPEHHYYADISLSVVQALGVKPHGDDTESWVTNKARQSVRSRFGKDNTCPIVVIHPGTSLPCADRRWPAEKYAQLIRQMHIRWPAIEIYLTGTSHENTLLHWIADKCHTNVKLINDLSIHELMALIEMSRLIITNDTGPLHVALSLKTPVVGIFGPNDPNMIAAPSEELHKRFRALRAAADCTTNLGCNTYAQADAERQNVIRWLCPQPQRVCPDAVDVSEVMRSVEDLDILDFTVASN